MRLINSGILAILLFSTSVASLRANSFRYDWVPTSGTPGFILTGSYIDLNASSGSSFGSGAILDWHIVTPSGTLTDLNSTLNTAFLQWNSSIIQGLMGGVIGSSSSATFFGNENVFFAGTAGLGMATGSWQDPPSPSVPDQASTSILLLIAAAGLGATHRLWRKPTLAAFCARNSLR